MEYNNPSHWRHLVPFPTKESHKYSRGHAVIVGGGSHMTGAARLAAIAALRAGAGLVTVAIPPEALPIYAVSLLSVMVRPVENSEAFAAFINDAHRDAFLIGPGNGIHARTRSFTHHILATGKPCVLDADALTAFDYNPAELFDVLHPAAVLTPHEGEFARLFSCTGERVMRAQEAARQSGAVIVLKGAETVIAHPDGRVVVNDNASFWLATAGSGDVLAGIITGLLAQRVPPFEAACMGVWMHGKASSFAGPGMIAEDLPGLLQVVWQGLAMPPTLHS